MSRPTLSLGDVCYVASFIRLCHVLSLISLAMYIGNKILSEPWTARVSAGLCNQHTWKTETGNSGVPLIAKRVSSSTKHTCSTTNVQCPNQAGVALTSCCCSGCYCCTFKVHLGLPRLGRVQYTTAISMACT